MKTLGPLALAVCLLPATAAASCGAAYCAASNDWLSLTQGVAQGWRVWGQVEYLKQDQARQGTKPAPADAAAAPHQEIKTLNRNLLLGVEYGFAPDWSASLVLPYSRREHFHLSNDPVPSVPETWRFEEIGDVRLQLRYQPGVREAGATTWYLQGGLKLPTGKTDIRNAAGVEAERSLQPGSGTTDLLLGGGVAYAPLSLPGSLFANLSLQAPFADYKGYQPGWRSSAQAGWLVPLRGKLDLILQGNVLYVRHDRGVSAEPDESGRTEVALVPGLAYAWSRKLSVYGQLELPVYQNVRGVQLTHDYAVSAGLSLRLD